jgi:RNA polymerase sigma factor (sigma-70 family)
MVASEELSRGEDFCWLQSVFERLESPLLVYCSRLLGGDLDCAQDCVQEAFVRLCKAPRTQVESYVDAWLFKTCRNIAMDIHRQESRMAKQSHELATTLTASREADPHEAIVDREQKETLQEKIGNLPSLEKEVVLLRLGQGLSYQQIADVMDLSVSHVGVLLHQALGRLRLAMNPSK